MSVKIETMKAFTQIGFNRLDRACQGITEEQLDWMSCSEANTIRWILTHLNSEFYVFVPKIRKGLDYNSELPEGYVGEKSLSQEKIMSDLEEGKKSLMKLLDDVTEEQLAVKVDWFLGNQPREMYLMMAISEIIHHEGQIAAILGVEKRLKGT